jgi:hypothetical protein
MEYIELKLSENTTGELSSNNPAIRLMRSRFGATLMLLVSLLYPIESFSANCQLKSSPICVDATPCKDILDSSGNTVKVCLSTAYAPPGALVSTASCWQYKAVYDCMDQTSPSYSDSCTPIKNGGNCTNYAELSSACAPDFPALGSGACAVFDVKYQCEIAPGNPYTETTCNSTSTCVDKNGNPAFCTGPTEQEKNTSFGLMVAGQETAREAGVYAQKELVGETDPNNISIFLGEANRCAEGMWGMAPNCCHHDGKGGNASNAIITEWLVTQGWNEIANSYLGSGYMYDSLLDKTVNLVEKALATMQEIMGTLFNETSAVATTASNIANVGAGGAAAGGVTLANTANLVGGAVGGAVVGAAATQYASSHGANTGWTGTIGAFGSMIGTVAGTYVAGAAYGGALALFGGEAAGTVAAGAATGGGEAFASLGWVGMIIMLVVMIIMAFAACTPEDAKTELKLGVAGLCHYVGTYCNVRGSYNDCITKMQSYCCFNGRLGRIIQEGAKQQLPSLGGWGTPKNPNCAGLKVSDLSQIDFSKIDLSEFVADVVAKNVPDGSMAATETQSMTNLFMNANQFDLTATDGIIVTSSNQQLPPPQLPSIIPATVTLPPMLACNIAFSVTGILADGTETGKFDITQCNPGAVIVWTNQGNCIGSPATSTDTANSNFTSSTMDANGNGSISFTLPPACFQVTSPATQSLWKGTVTLQPYGTIGVIDANWQ